MRPQILRSSTRAGDRVAGVLCSLLLALSLPAVSAWAATRDFHFRPIGSEQGLALVKALAMAA